GDNPGWPTMAFARIPVSRCDGCLTLAMKIARQYGPLADSAPGRALRALVRRLRRPTDEKGLQQDLPALLHMEPATLGPGVHGPVPGAAEPASDHDPVAARADL